MAARRRLPSSLRSIASVAGAAAMVLAASSFSVDAAAQQGPPAKPAPSAPASAPGSPPAPASSADMAEAKLRFEEGLKLAENGDHEAARLKFNQAWALLKSPSILFNLARAESLSNHLVEAYDHYREFFKLPPDPKISDTQRQRATEKMQEISKKVALVDIEAPASARVMIDGRAVDPMLLINHEPVAIPPGSHTFASFASTAKTATLDCPAGSVTRVKLVDEIIPVPSPTDASGGGDKKPNRKDEAGPSPSSSSGFWSGGRIAGAGLVGVGLVGLGLGVVFQMGVGSAKDDAASARASLPDPKDSACTDPTTAAANTAACGKLKSSVDDQHSKETLRTAFFIGGGAFVVGGAVLFLVSGPSKSETNAARMRFVPILSDREAGAALFGRF